MPSMEQAGEVVRRSPFGENPAVGLRGATTQRRILGAALGVFSEHTYHDTTVERITEAAGCSRPAFYQYFSSKEELFWRLAGHFANDMGELTEGIGAVTPDAEGLDHLRRWLDAFIDLCTQYHPILSGYRAAPRDRRLVGDRVGAAILRSAGPGHPELARPALTNTIVVVVTRTIHYWQIGLGQLSRSRFIDGVAQTIHRLLHGAVEGVNVTPVRKPPSRRAPSWPQWPDADADVPALRPRGRKTRQQLLDAGSAVLPKRGYHNTRVDDIVEAAGVSHGSFYRYFNSKDHLFHVLAEEAATAMVELVSSFPEGAEPEPLHGWLDRWFTTYRENGGVISAWQEIDYDDPALQAYSLEVAIVIFDRLQRIVHQRAFGDPAVDSLVLLSVIERVPYSVLAEGHIDPDEAVAASAFVVRRGLFGRPVA